MIRSCKKFFVSLAMGMFVTLSFGATISGVIYDRETKQTLPYADVELLALADSSQVTGDSSDGDGKFLLEDVSKGEYWLRVSFMGYEDRYRKVKIESDTTKLSVGRVVLKTDEKLLEEVAVLANATPLQVKEDTLIYNASSFRVADGAMLEDLVKKLPGAELTTDGKLVVNGKEVKKILVDGKEFFSDDPKVSLKNLPANMVKNVKAYDKKSESAQLTGVEDDEDEMVLDLSVKKGMKDGWVGNVFGGIGHDLRVDDPDWRFEAGGSASKFSDNANFSIVANANNTNSNGSAGGNNMNASAGNGINTVGNIGLTFAKERSKKYDYGGNVQYNHSKNDAQRNTHRETYRKSGTTYSDEEENSLRRSDKVSSSFRFKWTPDSMTNITFRPNISYTHSKSEVENDAMNFNKYHQLNYDKSTSKLNEGDNLNLNSSLRFVRKLNNKGRNIGLNASVGYTHSPSEQSSTSRTSFRFYEDSLDIDETIDSLLYTDRWTDKENNNLNYSVEASYTEPLFPRHYLTFRYRFQHRGSDSYSYVFDHEDLTARIDSLSSSIENSYNTHRAEVGFQGRSEKMNYNIGFALQPQTSSTHNLLGKNVGKDKKQTVLNFSPSLRYMYRFDKQSNVMLRYSGQSSAPDVEDLQEVIDETDPMNLRYGNPDLKPSYTNNISARFKKYNSDKQSSIMANLSFRNVVNAISNVILYDPSTGAQAYRRTNVNGNWNASAQFSNSTPFRKHRSFLFSSNMKASYSNDVSYEGDSINSTDYTKRKTHMLDLYGKYQLGYNHDKFDTHVYVVGMYQKSETPTEELEAGLDFNVNLPWNMILSTDLNYHRYWGYSDSFDEDAILWNASLTKNFMKNNAGALRFKVFDILGQQSNLNRRVSESSVVESIYNTLGTYFLIQFTYKFNTLGAKASKEESEKSGREGGFQRGDRPDGGFGGPGYGRPEGGFGRPDGGGAPGGFGPGR
ncbi:MAG: outer membrane beta-barrel protein [Paludibacteraceae bacterium]|nr:outer membrane beta-barrel protein [Paludibacteraceae bacterium]